MEKIKAYILSAFQLDLRALALMRVAVALVMLYDLSIRIGDIDAFYLESGIAKSELMRSFAAPAFTHTLLYWSQGDAWVYGIFATHVVTTFMLLFGYRTRLATLLCWILLMSEHSRNPLILQGGDDLLRLTLFWAIFLPWGKRYSVDAASYHYESENTYTGIPAMAYILQIGYVFVFSALLKGDEWHTDYTSLYYAYHLDQIAHPMAKFLAHFPLLLKVLTACAFYVELLAPFLLIIPDKKQINRTAAVSIYVLFHLWNGITLYVGLFYLIGIATVLGCLPATVINRMEQILPLWLTKQNGTKTHISVYKPILMIRDFLLLTLMVYVFMWNASNGNISSYKLADEARWLGNKLRLDQHWGMFAPRVFKEDGWYIYEAVLYNGDTIDLNRNAAPVSYEKPENIVALYKSDRWRKFGELYSLLNYAYIRMYLCTYLQQKWNEQHPENKIKHMRIIYMRETTLPDYAYSKPEPDVLYTCGVDLIQPR
jgi:hypothetical protein